MTDNIFDIGPECFSNGEVIFYKGENYYKSCDVLVTNNDDGNSYCVKRVGHPGVLHEDYDGNVSTGLPLTKPFISDITSPDAPMETNEHGGSQSRIPVRFDLIDANAMFQMAKVLHTGAEKYGEDNWRKIPVNAHINHLLMHAFAYLAGDETDEHLSHILCRATFAQGVALQENWVTE